MVPKVTPVSVLEIMGTVLIVVVTRRTTMKGHCRTDWDWVSQAKSRTLLQKHDTSEPAVFEIPQKNRGHAAFEVPLLVVQNKCG
jgi:hypothetical protein